MMNEERIREYREEAIVNIQNAAKRHDLYLWELACERVWTLDFILHEATEEGYIHPEDRFPFGQAQEAAR
jgi:hypothetical protein